MYKFSAYGHENITTRHKTTLEFTKDKDLSLKGDCIIGVKADFELAPLKKFIKKLIQNNNMKIKIIIESSFNKSIKNGKSNKRIVEIIKAEINPSFNSSKDMVIRKSDFKDERTFAIKSNKSSAELSRDFVNFLGNPNQKLGVIIKPNF